MTTSKTTRLVRTGRLHIRTYVFDEWQEPPADYVVYKHVYAVPVWHIDMIEVAYWELFTKQGYPLGRVTTLRYLEEAHDDLHRKRSSNKRI